MEEFAVFLCVDLVRKAATFPFARLLQTLDDRVLSP